MPIFWSVAKIKRCFHSLINSFIATVLSTDLLQKLWHMNHTLRERVENHRCKQLPSRCKLCIINKISLGEQARTPLCFCYQWEKISQTALWRARIPWLFNKSLFKLCTRLLVLKWCRALMIGWNVHGVHSDFSFNSKFCTHC